MLYECFGLASNVLRVPPARTHCANYILNKMLSPKDFDRIIRIDKLRQSSDELWASGQDGYGSFDPDTYRVIMNYSDSEIDKLLREARAIGKSTIKTKREQASQEYLGFVQAWIHEHVHLFQALLLPAMRNYVACRRHMHKIDVITALRYWEMGGRYELGTHTSPRSVLSDPDIILPESFYTEMKKHDIAAEQILEGWLTELNGMSAHHLIEGMAHICSLHFVAPHASTDYLSLESGFYNYAFDYFSKSSSCKSSDTLTLRILFIHTCYWALHVAQDWQRPATQTAPVKAFFHLAEMLPKYLMLLEHRANKFYRRKPDLSWLRQRLASGFQIEEVRLPVTLTIGQAVSILAMGEIVQEIRQDSLLFAKKIDATIKLNRHKELDSFVRSAKKLCPGVGNINGWHKLMSIPDVFFELTSELKTEEIEFSSGSRVSRQDNEADFYDMFKNLRHLLNPGKGNVFCCEKHRWAPVSVVRNCAQDGSMAATLTQLVGRPFKDLVSI